MEEDFIHASTVGEITGLSAGALAQLRYRGDRTTLLQADPAESALQTVGGRRLGGGQRQGAHLAELRVTVEMGLFAAKNAVLTAARLGLGGPATRLLLHMALECFDQDRDDQLQRRYFAGRESSAIALGYLAPDNGSEAAHHAVKRAMRELIQAGAIHRVRTGGRGATSEYELNVDSSRPPSVYRELNQPIPFPIRGGS